MAGKYSVGQRVAWLMSNKGLSEESASAAGTERVPRGEQHQTYCLRRLLNEAVSHLRPSITSKATKQ